jgi:hypothetical protein
MAGWEERRHWGVVETPWKFHLLLSGLVSMGSQPPARLSLGGAGDRPRVVRPLTKRCPQVYPELLLLFCSFRSTAALRLGHISSGTRSALS